MAKKTAKVDVFKEMAALGKQVHDAFETAAKSEEVKGIADELSKGLRRVGGKGEEAVDAAKQSEKGKAIGKQVKKVVEAGKKQGKTSGEELRKHLAGAMKELGEQLAKVSKKLKDR